MTFIATAVLALTSLLLFAYGVNLLYLSWRSLRVPCPEPPGVTQGAEPLVCVQLPVFNERHVAERVIDAACQLDWPLDRLEIQVLDDSDDDTVAIVQRRVGLWRRRGLRIRQFRRSGRAGYKAGALARGLEMTRADFVAVFDADFVPPEHFLRRIIGAFEDPAVGFAQARWGHLNESYSWLTRLQALAIDFHFLVEQAARSTSGYFTNFTGTAGVWRRAAIGDAGGWSDRTLTEDLDLSYRAQLRGWRPCYVDSLEVPEELPVDINAYRRQQSRWATGSFQVALRQLGPIWRSRHRPAVKVQASLHLLSYAVAPVMLAQLACYPFLLVAASRHDPFYGLGVLGLAMNLITLGHVAAFAVAEVRRGRRWWTGLPGTFCKILGAGLAVTILLAMVRAFQAGGRFERTPKYRIEERGQEWRHSDYVRLFDPRALLEAALGLTAGVVALAALRLSAWLVALYAGLFAVGLVFVSVLTIAQALHVVTLRRAGHGPLRRVRAAAPLVGLLLVAAALLGAVAMIGDPFEDSYHHWLVAAYLAQTGSLHDPLFGMEDTWLPGYHLLAAGVLKVFGLWQLGSLKALSVGFGLLTLAGVHQLASTPRQGRLAVALLALNPIFLLTATSVVAEPLTTALVTGAGLAAVRGRGRLAALAAAGACLTATKAWIWVVALLVVLVGQRLLTLTANAGPRPKLAWALPALGVLVLLQLGFAPASHSMARGAVEVGSATVRGSLPGSSAARLGDFAGYFSLASLPLVLLAPLGLYAELRGGALARARGRLLHLPAMGYLGAVGVLVAAGFYSGSHRYYYLALPALALLAAAALERVPSAAALGTTAAAALAAIGFIPIFASFSAENTGLAAAGWAASTVPGPLLTDSPVAAYASHKPPSQIVGSRALPAGRGDATAWMRARGVTALVVEDIDYYQAKAVFPELARGQASEPFQPLGDESAYRTSGGKRVFAYRLGSGGYTANLGSGLQATLPFGGGSSEETGKAAPLAKGLGLSAGGRSFQGEGVGFGVPIAHYPDGWYYPGTAVTGSGPGNVFTKTFQLDLAGVQTDHGYVFQRAGSRGRIEVRYGVRAGLVRVDIRELDLSPGYDQVVILNEQSGAFDDFADSSQSLFGSSLGPWVPARGDWARMRSEKLRLEWSQPAVAGAQLMGGREEKPPDFDWAGLEYLFTGQFTSTGYTITIGGAR